MSDGQAVLPVEIADLADCEILHETAEAPDILATEVTPAVSAPVMQLLAKRPEERIQSATALSQMLATIQ